MKFYEANQARWEMEIDFISERKIRSEYQLKTTYFEEKMKEKLEENSMLREEIFTVQRNYEKLSAETTGIQSTMEIKQ